MMRLFQKVKKTNGRHQIYFCGIKILSYKKILSKTENCLIVGKNNKIIGDNGKVNIHIEIYGDNNIVNIETSDDLNVAIFIGTKDCPISGCEVFIGKNTTSNGLMIRLLESESKVIIGEDCMFSDDVSIYCSDTHSILNQKGMLLNVGKYVVLGNHVWVCQGARILKNTTLGNGCVIGMRSVVTHKEVPYPDNCVLAGCPAKIIKKDIHWERKRPQKLINIRHYQA